MLRTMRNAFRDFEFYSSTFDTDTGVLVRQVEVPGKTRKYGWWESGTLLTESIPPVPVFYTGGSYQWEDDWHTAWAEAFGQSEGDRGYIHPLREKKAFSPVPETIDVKVTNWCNGPGGELCSYCYMDSTTKGKHAPRALLESIFSGLPEAPYQIAFGGGEPTAHPDFPWFLEYTRSKGTVPNYTTAGHIMRPDVLEATNKYAGGVALTYHAFKGPTYFKEVYEKWRAALDKRVALNVHVIFDNDVANSLLDLQDVGLTHLSVVLLAYYPEVGRSKWQGIPSKGVYTKTLPDALTKVVSESKFRIAFSEGLLPYFLSRQLPEVDTRFAQQQEGLFFLLHRR